MKKFVFSAIAILALASCAKEVIPAEDLTPKGETVTISAAIADTKSTEANATFSWASNETISVGTSEAEYVAFEVSDAENGTFTHTFDGAAPQLLAAVSPSQASDVEFADATAFEVQLPATYTYSEGVTNALMIGKPDPQTANKFLFSHAAALLKITYANVPVGTQAFHLSADKNITGTVTLDGTSVSDIEIANTNSGLTGTDVTIALSEPVSAAGSTMSFYVPVPTGDYSLLTISLQNNAGDIAASVKTMDRSGKSPLSLNRADVFNFPTITLTEETKDEEYTIEFINKTNGSPSAISNSTGASTVIESSCLAYVTSNPFSDVSNAYYGGDNTNGLPLRIGKSGEAGSVTIALSESGVVAAKEIIINAKQYSSGKTKKIGVNDSEKQQPGDNYGDLSFTLSGDELEQITLQTDGYIYVKYIKVIYTPKKSASLSFPESSYSIVEGESFTAPLLTTNPVGLDVSYSSSNEDVATVNATSGDISILGVGTTKITAFYAGNDEYKSAKASYILIVTRTLATSIAQLKSDLNGSTTAMDFTVSLTNAVVTRKFSDYIAYIQDSSAGILVSDADSIEEGDSYTGIVTGTIITANNQPKITSLDLSEATKTTGVSKTPVEVSIATLISNMDEYDGMLCKIVKAKAEANLVTGTNKSVSISQGESSLTFFTRVSFEENTVVANHYYDIVGLPCKYNSTNEIVVIKTDDVTESSISWQLSSIGVATQPTKRTYTVGEKFNPAGLVISTVYVDANDHSILMNGDNIAYDGNESDFSFNPALDVELTTDITGVEIIYGEKTVTQNITVSESGSKTYTVEFLKDNNNSSVQNYTSSFTVTDGELTLSLQNFNNNNKGWDVVKAGPKKATGQTQNVSTATITSPSLEEAIKTVTVSLTLDRGSATAKLYVASDDTFVNNVQTIDYGTVASGDIVFTVPTATASSYYKVEFTCTNTTTTNGVISVSKIQYSNK